METMAGQGTEIGRDFNEINTILQLINNQERIGICLDTVTFLRPAMM